MGGFLTFSLLSLSFCFKNESAFNNAILAACAGAFVISFAPLFISYCVELTYPAPQASATGYLFVGSQTMGFVSGMVWVSVLDKTSKWKAYLLLATHALCVLLAFLITLATKEVLNKRKYEL